MNKIFIIIQREYITRVRKKSFIISTLLAPLGFFALILFSVLMSNYSGGTKQVGILDESGLFASVVFPDAPDGSVDFHYEHTTKGSQNKKYDALILIPAHYDIDNPRKVSINCTSEKSIGMIASGYINRTFSDKIRQLRAGRMSISQDQLENLNTDIELTYQKISEDKKRDANGIVGMGFGYLIGIAIYTLLLVYGTMIMKGVVEEKTSRIMEVLVSSVKPVQLMLGKILGIAAVGLTQFILWIILMGISVFFIVPMLGFTKPPRMEGMPAGGGGMDPDMAQQVWNVLSTYHYGPMVIVLIVFFLGGFLLYGSLFAAIGAAGGDETDSQSLTFPVILPIIITIAMMTNVLGQPEGKLAIWASLIPFSSPIIMPALMPTGPPLWQILLSMAFLFGGFILCVMLAAKIYRTGILMYGKKTTFKEIGRWIFTKN